MNSRESREVGYKNRKVYKTNNHTYQRNQDFYFGNRGRNFSNSYGSNGSSTRNAFHSRSSSRYYQHNRREPFESYKEYHWQQARKIRREPSPLNGSEEYALRKIQETSDMIKRQLMSPEYIPLVSNTQSVSEPISNKSTKSTIAKIKLNKIRKGTNSLKRKVERKVALRAKLNKSLTIKKVDPTYNVKEIHDQIMNHISKLNYGRKKNLINADSTCYDSALQLIYKQKSLELSNALREMSRQEKPEASEVVNSIIPDFAIKFEDLPVHVIRELSSTFETNFGYDDNSFAFNVFKNSTKDQVLHETTPVHVDIQEYLPGDNSFQSASHSNLSFVQSDDRVLHLNSEDADTFVIKEENLIENSIKTETIDIIEIEDDASSENDTCPFTTQISSVSQHQGEIKEHIPDNPNIVQSSSNKSPDFEMALSSETNAVIGTIRVSKSIFENKNTQISMENQNENPLNENQAYFGTSCSSNEMIPNLSITMNINKAENHLSEIHSATYNNLSVEKSLNSSSSSYVANNESSNDQMNRIITIKKEVNDSEVITGVRNDNISFREERHPLLDASRTSDEISSNLSQVELSSDILNQSCNSSQLGIPLAKNMSGSNEQGIKRNCNSTISTVRFSKKGVCFDDGNVTSHNSDISSVLNIRQPNESKRHQNDLLQGEKSNKYCSVEIKKFEVPKDIVGVLDMMLEVDGEIEKLIKFRQSILLKFRKNQNSQDFELDSLSNGVVKKKKRKINSIARKAKKRKQNCHNNQAVVTCPTIQIQQGDSCQEKKFETIQIEDNIIDRLEKSLIEMNNCQQKKNYLGIE